MRIEEYLCQLSGASWPRGTTLNTNVFRIIRLGNGAIVPFLLNARRPTHNVTCLDAILT